MRRGEIAITTVIVVALGLLVLTILAITLTSSTRNLDQNVNDCKKIYDGSCMAESQCEMMQGKTVSGVRCDDTTTYKYTHTVIESFPEGGTVCCVT